MAFTIYYTEGRKAYDDSHSLVVKDSGIIEVTKDGEQVALYSPNYWTKVKPGTPPKTAKPRVGRIY